MGSSASVTLFPGRARTTLSQAPWYFKPEPGDGSIGTTLNSQEEWTQVNSIPDYRSGISSDTTQGYTVNIKQDSYLHLADVVIQARLFKSKLSGTKVVIF